MTEKVNAGTANVAENVAENVEKKVIRRGIGNARGASRLKFSHEMAARNGLFIGHLDSVELSMIKIGEDTTGMPSFNGLEIPRLTLMFASNEPEINKRHYVPLVFTTVESNVETIPGGKKEWAVNNIFDAIKHIMDVYVTKGRDFTQEEEEALSLPFIDFNENGEYSPVAVEEVISGWKQLFENFADILNHSKNGEAVYKDSNNKPITVWMKLLRYNKTKKGWREINNGELAFSPFVGEGYIEIFKKGSAPSLRLNPIKECITVREDIEPKKPTNIASTISNGPAPIMGGVPVMDNGLAMGGFDNASIDAADDMPF